MTCSYRFISEHRASFAVALLCRVLGVRRPGFYEWIAAAPVRAAHAAMRAPARSDGGAAAR